MYFVHLKKYESSVEKTCKKSLKKRVKKWGKGVKNVKRKKFKRVKSVWKSGGKGEICGRV